MNKHRASGGEVKGWGVSVYRRRGVLHALGAEGVPICRRVRRSVQVVTPETLPVYVCACTSCARRAVVRDRLFELASILAAVAISPAAAARALEIIRPEPGTWTRVRKRYPLQRTFIDPRQALFAFMAEGVYTPDAQGVDGAAAAGAR